MTQKCRHTGCQFDSIPVYVEGDGKCDFHWTQEKWGIEWASQCHPGHPEAIKQDQPTSKEQ